MEGFRENQMAYRIQDLMTHDNTERYFGKAREGVFLFLLLLFLFSILTFAKEQNECSGENLHASCNAENKVLSCCTCFSSILPLERCKHVEFSL